MKKHYCCNQHRHQIGCGHWKQPNVSVRSGSDVWDVIDISTPLKDQYPRTYNIFHKLMQMKVRGRTVQYRLTQGVILTILGMVSGQVVYAQVFALAYVEPPEIREVRDYKTFIVHDDSIPPILEAIAKCESGGSQFDKNGKVIRGKVTPTDIGKFQISEPHWGAKAKALQKQYPKMNFDIYTAEGNENMAMWIYFNRGTDDWVWSKPCWNRLKAN